MTRASVRRTTLISPQDDSYKAREHKEKDIEMVLRPRSACVDRPLLLRSTDDVYVCSRRRNNVEKGRREKMRQMGS